MADGGPVQKWNLMMAIQRDGSLSDGARRTAMFLLDRHNYRTGRCFPSYNTLADDAGIERRSAIRHVQQLIDAGWLSVERELGGDGFSSNRFSFAWGRLGAHPSDNSVTPLVTGESLPSDSGATTPSDNSVTPPSDRGVTLTYEDITCESVTCESNLDARPSGSLTIGKPSETAGAGKPSQIDSPTLPLALSSPAVSDGEGLFGRELVPARKQPPTLGSFGDWYRNYPRKVGRGAAEKAYERVIRSGQATVDELLAGAMRYAAERQNDDPKYIKHPATWLNAKCWLDEPVQQVRQPAVRPGSAAMGILNVIAEREGL